LKVIGGEARVIELKDLKAAAGVSALVLI
jgi:hypothetical protein